MRVQESLADLARLNRYLGGIAALNRQLGLLLGDPMPGRLRVLDVGCGGCDVLQAVGRWCGRRNIVFEGVGLDIGSETARLAARWLAKDGGKPAIEIVRGDGRSLPFDDRSFDVTICNTLLHHFDPEAVIQVLSGMARVSKLGIVASDLRRDVFGYCGAWMLAKTIWRRHDYTRHDALVSMRAAYTLAEVRGMAVGAGLTPAAEPQLWFRWILRWKRPA